MSLFSKIYSQLTQIHRGLYDKEILKKVRVGKPVLSVGNITFGGTGKTPFVKRLVQDLNEMNKKPAVVVKSYKGKTKVSQKVDREASHAPTIWGDEACWYFKNTKAPVYAGPLKWQSAMLAEKNEDVDLIVIDDGFQHHKLHRDFNIVLIDALAGLKSLQNRSRDSLCALSLADAIILSRSNMVSVDTLQKLKDLMPKNKKLFLNQTRVKNLRDHRGLKVTPEARVGLVSGIANPASFRIVFEKEFPGVHVETLNFPDHHDFSREDLGKIEKFQRENNLDQIVMTEKDEIKLGIQNFLVLEVESVFENEAEWKGFLSELVG